MMLGELGIAEISPRGERVAILVGPNGSGKSRYLRELVKHYRYHRDIAIVCNTAYDRFANMRGVERISSSHSGQAPKQIIKRVVSRTLDADDSRFHQIAAVMGECGYQPRFGFRLELPYRMPEDRYFGADEDFTEDFRRAVDHLRRGGDDIIWIDPTQPNHEFSRMRDFAVVLQNEAKLRARKYLKRITVYLQRNDRMVIELRDASSGELTLIASLLFLIATAKHNPLIIVDEPENSLHPGWQRDYVDKVLGTLGYRNASIVIATHAPLIVTGALATNPDIVSVFQMHRERPSALRFDGASSRRIEEILWRAFDVVTPANHFVSEEIVDLIARYERDDATKDDVLNVVQSMDSESFDETQKAFFQSVRNIVEKVAIRKSEAEASADDD